MFYIRDLFGKCDQIFRKLRIWSYLLKKFLMENFIFCAVDGIQGHIIWSRSTRSHLRTATMINDLQWNFFRKNCFKDA